MSHVSTYSNTAVNFYFLDQQWHDEPNRWNPATQQRKGAGAPTQFLEAPSCYYLIGRNESLETYLRYARNWCLERKNTIRKLVLSAHGNAGELKIGSGLQFSNAGMFKLVRECFDPRGYAQKLVQIFGCGVASDRQVDLLDLPADPNRPEGMTTYKGQPAYVIKSTATNRDILMVQGVYTPSGPGKGYQLMKAIADCARVPVQAPINMESNFPPYFKYNLPTVWVYPDNPGQEESFEKHNDSVVVRR